MKLKKIIVLTSLAIFGATVNGQVRQPHALYFMETIPQISQMNPAFQPRANGFIALPVNFNLDYRNDLSLRNLLQKQGNNWYSPVEKQYDYNQLYNSIGKKAAMINNGMDADIFGFGFRAGKGYFTLGVSEHQTGVFALPKDLFQITDKGFPENTSLDFSPLRTQSIAYMQLSIGYSHRLNDRLTIGVNVKPLAGQVAVASKIDRFKLYTGEEQWDIDASGNVYSSLPIEDVVTDAEGKIKEVNFRETDNYKFNDFVKDYVTSFKNPGIAFDLGAEYKITERLAISAALNNLGFISWKKDLNGISFNGKYTFDGVYYDTSKDDKIEDLFKNLGDSILDAMKYKVQHDKFTTPLAPVLHAGATYNLSQSVSVGLLSRTVFWQNAVRQSFHASFNLQPYSFFALNAGATWQVKGNVYMGGGFMFLLGPLQIYTLVDCIPIRYSTITIDDKRWEYDLVGNKTRPFPVSERFQTFTLRVGINLVFGRHGYVNKPMLDRGKSGWN